MESNRPLTQEEQNARLVAKEEYKKLALLEEMSWRQKSREIWFKREKGIQDFARFYYGFWARQLGDAQRGSDAFLCKLFPTW